MRIEEEKQAASPQGIELQEDPALILYRDRAALFLRRYFQLSAELGRLPSALGREFFRTNATLYAVQTFEDVVIFVHDMERCLAEISNSARAVIERVIFQDYSQIEAAQILEVGRCTVQRKLGAALDEVSRILIQRGMLIPIRVLDGIAPEKEDGKESFSEEQLPPKKPVRSIKTIQAVASGKTCQGANASVRGLSN